MSKIKWDETGKRFYKTGVDHVILFPLIGDTYGDGVAWNGVTSVAENPEGAEANDIYADNMKYLSLISAENWKGSIKAYTYPDEYNACQGIYEYNDGTAGYTGVYFGQQTRQKFGLAWRSIVGNDTEGNDYGYELHLAYGLSAAPSEMDHATENDSPEAQEMSWDLNSIPVAISDSYSFSGSKFKPTSHIVIPSRNNALYEYVEGLLMGQDDNTEQEGDQDLPSVLPLPNDILAQINAA